MTKLAEIEGIGEAFAKQLQAAGVTSVGSLLAQAASAAGRKALAAKSGISAKLLLEWVNHADLFRITGVGSEYADLLEAAGVDSVPELAQRQAEHLWAKLQAVNQKKALVRKMPALAQVTDWIAQAGQLKRVVTH